MGCSSSQTIIIQEAAPAKSQAEQLDPVPEVVQAQIAVVPEVHAERSEADIPEALPGLVEAEKISVKSGDQNISNDYDGPEGVEWTKVGSSMTWAASEDYASIRKGRLLTLEEARQFLKKRGDFALYPGEDQWVACVRADGVRDWVQLGNKIHHLGKSHVDECGGYPRWGDDSSGKPPFACSVMWLSSGVVPSPKPQWKKHGTSFTWGSSKEHASKAGGRLLDLKEARSFLGDHGPLWPGEDQWVAVTRSDGTAWRDWLQVGNKIHHLGKSHVDECGGYPHWGDDSSGNPPHARSVLWIEDLDPEDTKKGPIWQKQSCSLTWEASKQNAARLGGRLLLLEEAEDFLKKSGALCPGGDQWAAVVASDGSRDWIQAIHHMHVHSCGSPLVGCWAIQSG
ncbi:unnamed protein product [Durusdinium trenchii]|uniref:Uncharacterized protein n=1 Tax=Durusdinium trenchii TaxID=1381693 RepID=A0ABP0JTB3_9DINO